MQVPLVIEKKLNQDRKRGKRAGNKGVEAVGGKGNVLGSNLMTMGVRRM